MSQDPPAPESYGSTSFAHISVQVPGTTLQKRDLPIYVGEDKEDRTLLQLVITDESAFISGQLLADGILPKSLMLNLEQSAEAGNQLAAVFEQGVEAGAFDKLIERDKDFPANEPSKDFFGYKRSGTAATRIVTSHEPLPPGCEIVNIPEGALSISVEYEADSLAARAVVAFPHNVVAAYLMAYIEGKTKVRLVGLLEIKQPLWNLVRGYDQAAAALVAELLPESCQKSSDSTPPQAVESPAAS